MNGLPEPSVEPPEPTYLAGVVTVSGNWTGRMRIGVAEKCVTEDDMIKCALDAIEKNITQNQHPSLSLDIDDDPDVKLDGQNPMGD